jgi:L-lysine exporter family protein LysE/ArgO
MWQSYSNGLLVAIGLIMAIGAQNAFVLAQSLRREHHLPVAALCIVCDAVLVAAGVFGLATLLVQSPTLLTVARWGGAAFLIWYGSQALLRAARPQSLQAADSEPRSLRAVMLAALAVTLLNPHVYLDTVLLIGSLGAGDLAPDRSGRGDDDVQRGGAVDSGGALAPSPRVSRRVRFLSPRSDSYSAHRHHPRPAPFRLTGAISPPPGGLCSTGVTQARLRQRCG